MEDAGVGGGVEEWDEWICERIRRGTYRGSVIRDAGGKGQGVEGWGRVGVRKDLRKDLGAHVVCKINGKPYG